MIKETIILAGGLGTRLRPVVSDLPKCMAPVNGKPFLSYIIDYLQKQGVEKYILSVGYKSESIIEYLNAEWPMLNVEYSHEETPLGTGGAIKRACAKVSGKNVLIVNGDTMFCVDLNKLSSFHAQHEADCTLSLKPMKEFDRYGAVELDNNDSIRSFKEKHFYKEGLINGGVYGLNAERFIKEDLPEVFSFEKDYLEKYLTKRKIFGVVQDEYFIDIGIPEDYNRAQKELINEINL
jgi:D-glycero-alpha-D-manno-heptose 1-phosphate guanylyltransferase